ncbi:hypothetical protein M407DRAFT_24815 [Tulasnella calospora MUT 4182]|uniref:Symplekin n=1 Tax=Tulasnella calospora MUT 4182 TaxID=1051891 RepID=A0A0C3QIP3_9AGAM|nr:hypothetical protein M407DRAFT_24815 [Tulasnella calospora MUT 4182]
MDPVQELQKALSLPEDSPQQIQLLATLREYLEQQPAPITVIIPPLLHTIVPAKDSAFKRWVIDILHFGLSRSTLPGETKAQLATSTLEDITNLLNDPSLSIQKSAIQCFASSYPLMFRVLCVNRQHRGPWDMLVYAKQRILALVQATHGPSAGLTIAALKVMQRVILVQSRGVSDPRLQNRADTSLALCPPDHPFINASQLETEGAALLQQMLSFLFKHQNPEILSAIINCLVTFVKQRSSMIGAIVTTLGQWTPTHLQPTLSASQIKSVEKAIRAVLMHILRHALAPAFTQQINEILLEQVARMDVAAREEVARRAEASRKRALPEPVPEPSEFKRLRVEDGVAPPAQAGNQASLSILQTFDFTTLSQALVVDLVIANLIAVSPAKLNTVVANFRVNNPPPTLPPSTGPPTQHAEDPSSSKILAKAEPVPLDPLKMELDEDDLEYEPDKLNTDLERDGHAPEDDENDLAVALPDVAFELPPARLLSPKERSEMIRLSIQRIRSKGESGGILPIDLGDGDSPTSPVPVVGLSAQEAWILFIVRMATRGPVADVQDASGVEGSTAMAKRNVTSNANGIRQVVYDYVMDDFPARCRLATIWMNEEWYNDGIRREMDGQWQPQYDIWVQRLLAAQTPKLDAKDKTFTRFLIDLPSLPPNILSLLSDLCIDPDTMPVGFNSLRELVSLRPPLRTEAMRILLDLTTHPDKVIRGAAIITVRRWVPDQQPMDGMVRTFASGMLRRLATKPKLPNADGAIESDAMVVDQETITSEDEVDEAPQDMAYSSYLPPELVIPAEKSVVLQHIELLLGLAVKSQGFLKQIFDAYCRMEPSVQDSLQALIVPLVRTLGPNNSTLLDLLREFKPEAESLALRILSIWTENTRPTPGIISVVKDLLAERELDPKFLIIIIGEMDKADILKNLPKIISTLSGKAEDRDQVRKVFSNVVTDIPVGVSTNMPRVRQSERLAPSELMVLLHEQEKEIGLKATIEAIGICFAMSDVFTSEILAVVMQQLVDAPTLPVLFMRTVIQAVTTYKNLINFVATTLFSRLIVKKVWTNPQLWEGFIRCARITSPVSFGALLQLPKEQLREVVDKQPSLRDGLRDFVIKKERNKQKLASFLETLGDGGEIAASTPSSSMQAAGRMESPAPNAPPPISAGAPGHM